MKAVDIYDPPQSCVIGSCGSDAEDDLALFAATLESLQQRGFAVSRYNLGREPEAFARNPVVKRAIQTEGIAALPMVLLDGKIISKGRYPSRAELDTEMRPVAAGANARYVR